MPKRARKSEAYYYAGGERVALESALDLVAVDASIVEARGSSAAKRALSKARPLRAGLRLAETESLPKDVVDELGRQNALLPVLRFGTDLVVVLPEVRVEESRPEKVRALERWAETAKGRVHCEGAFEDGRVALRPTSGRGEDALAIANELHERLAPELAQARFVRVVRRPRVGARRR